MKLLTLIIHQSAKQDITDHLLQISEVTGFTMVAAEGHSEHTAQNPFETTRDRVLGYVPRYRVDVLIEDEDVERVMGNLRRCEPCVIGRGIWWVTPVEQWGRR